MHRNDVEGAVVDLWFKKILNEFDVLLKLNMSYTISYTSIPELHK